MRELIHPNIMHLFEVWDCETSLKIVMELVEGGQLADLIKKRPNLSWNEIIYIMQ